MEIQETWREIMRKALKNMFIGAGSLFDIEGHDKIKMDCHSHRFTSYDNPLYTDPANDSLNIRNDWANSVHDFEAAFNSLKKFNS